MSITRRDFLLGAAAAGAGSLACSHQTGRLAAPRNEVSGGDDFAFVHLTDMHVTTRRRGGEGWLACAESVRALPDKPVFALMGGDMAFDGMYTPKPDFEEQIRLFKAGSDALGIPWYPCMGNHDVLGWSSRRKVSLDDPDLGKKMIMDRLEWERPYYSFDYHGWHFAVLDCIFPVETADGPSYEARIGPEQLEWLGADLGSAGDRPKVVMTHIAAFCAINQINGNAKANAIGHMVVSDTKELRHVLERHKVKALLQGHSHDIQEFCYNDVWYLTSASASAAWWSGSWHGFDYGYTVFHCQGDTLRWAHKTFEWESHLDPADDLERKKTAEREAFLEEQRRLLERDRAAGQQLVR